MSRFEIRALLPGDEQQLLDIATHLDSVNLPADKGRIEEIVDLSFRSFSGAIKKPTEREYVFVLVDLERQVSLELAHVRDSGPTDPAKRKQLFDASQLEQKGEAAIKSGDYKSAEDSLLQAQVILRGLPD